MLLKKMLRGNVSNPHVTLLSGGLFTSYSTERAFRLSLTMSLLYLAETGA